MNKKIFYNNDYYDGDVIDNCPHGDGAYYKYLKKYEKYIYKYMGKWNYGKKEGIFSRYLLNDYGEYVFNGYEIYENDQFIVSYHSCGLKQKNIHSLDDFLKYLKHLKNIEHEKEVGKYIGLSDDFENYFGSYFITGNGNVPDGKGKLYEYNDPYGECVYEHVGEWRDGKRHGIFERYKNNGDWENLDLYSFDVYSYGKLIDRFYLYDLAKENIYDKNQFIAYYKRLKNKV